MRRSFWERRFGKPQELELEFELKLEADEYHVITVHEKLDGSSHRVPDPRELWDYGKTFERHGTTYCLPFRAIEALHTLRSMNPDIRDDGALVLEFLPPALEYLRKRKDVAESIESSKPKFPT